MRITAGKYKNRIVATRKGARTRPTPSLVREAVFNMCQNMIEGASFLDLFSGSGIMSFEAISRGAKSATLVEKSGQAVQIIKENVKSLAIDEQVTLLKGHVLQLIPLLIKQKKQFDLIYIDPPYLKGEGEKVIELIDHSPLLSKSGALFLEEGKELSFLNQKTLHLIDVRKFGSTFLHRFGL